MLFKTGSVLVSCSARASHMQIRVHHDVARSAAGRGPCGSLGHVSRPASAHRAARPSRLDRWRGVVDRYGWSVCLLPVVLAVTVFVVVDPNYGQASAPSRTSASPTAVSGPSASVPLAEPRPLSQADVVVGDPAASADTACAGSTQPQRIVVSVARQRAWMCAGDRQVYTTPVTTGQLSTGDATPAGSWTIEDKQTDRYLTGPGYSDFVHYWLPFYGDFGLHDASWQTLPFGDQGYRTHGSHGCVHLPTPAMAWLYDWAQIGTTVTVDP